MDLGKVFATANGFDMGAFAEAMRGVADPVKSFTGMLALATAEHDERFLEPWQEAWRYYEGAFADELSHYIATLQGSFILRGLPVFNPVPVPVIRSVNNDGLGPEGEEYIYHASPAAIARGLAVDIPVLLRYPDGRLEPGNEVRFTEAGLKSIEADMKGTAPPANSWGLQ